MPYTHKSFSKKFSKKTLGNGDHGEWWKNQELLMPGRHKFETLQCDMTDFPGGLMA